MKSYIRIALLVSTTFFINTFLVGQSKFFVNENATGANNGTSWNDAFTNLQDAIDACGGQLDTIWVAAGSYSPTKDKNGNSSPSNLETKTFYINKEVAIYGGFLGNETNLNDRDFSTNETFLDGNLGSGKNSYHVIHAENVSDTTVIDGFTIRNGRADKWGDEEGNNFGGGIFNNSDISIYNSKIENNHSVQGGAAVFTAGGAITFDGCTFSNNTFGYQAGIIKALNCTITLYDSDISGVTGQVINSENSNVNLYYSSFDNNTASQNLAILVGTNSNFSVNGSSFNNNSNSSTGKGGSFQLTNGIHNFRNSTFIDNTASNEGGSIHITNGDSEFYNCTFSSNTVTGTAEGGALYLKNGSANITETNFSDNKANNFGSAIYSEGVSLEVSRSNFVANLPSDNGVAIAIKDGELNINKTLFEENEGRSIIHTNTSGSDLEVTINACAFYNNTITQDGVLYFNSNTEAEISNTLIIQNTNSGSTSALKQNGGETEFLNCVIANNSTSSNDGAAVEANPGEIRSYNTIFWENNNKNGYKDYGNSNFKAYYSWFTNKKPTGQKGSQNTKGKDPHFLDINSPLGDDNQWFTLDDGYACDDVNGNSPINDGNNSYVNDLEEDITGNDRISDNTVDVGAYELKEADWVMNGNGDWHTGSNWANGNVPTNTDNVILNHENANGNYVVNINQDAEINILTIASNNITLQIASGVTLEYGEIQGVGKIVLEEHASLVPQNGKTGNVAGDFTVKRTKPNSWKFYNFWSSPVENGSISMLADAQAVYTMEKGTGNPSTVYTTIGSDSTMEVGRGYTAANVSDAQFTGLVNNGTITYDVSDENGAFNLIGNPYPSAISAQQFVSDNELILKNGTIWLWDQQEVNNGSTEYNTTTNFIAVNATGASSTGHRTATLASTDIASCQGFVVSADANGMVEFNNGQRNGENSNFKSGSNTTLENKELAWISLTYDDYKSTTLIGFGEQATSGFDFYYDTHGNVVKNGMQIGTTIKNDLFLINTYNNHTEELNIPLSVTIDHYKTSVKTFEISLDDSENLSETRTIYLKDNETGNIYNLSKDSTVAFPVTESFFDQERFEIISELNTTGINKNNHNNWFTSSINNNTITVSSSFPEAVTVMMYDVTGKLITKQQLGANQSVELELTKNVDIIHIVGNDINWTRKIK